MAVSHWKNQDSRGKARRCRRWFLQMRPSSFGQGVVPGELGACLLWASGSWGMLSIMDAWVRIPALAD